MCRDHRGASQGNANEGKDQPRSCGLWTSLVCDLIGRAWVFALTAELESVPV